MTPSSDLAALITDPRVETVEIAAAARTHVDPVVAAEAGKAVFCEKPMAPSIADAYTAKSAEFVAAARERRTPAVTGHHARRNLAMTLVCIESVQAHAPAKVAGVP